MSRADYSLIDFQSMALDVSRLTGFDVNQSRSLLTEAIKQGRFKVCIDASGFSASPEDAIALIKQTNGQNFPSSARWYFQEWCKELAKNKQAF